MENNEFDFITELFKVASISKKEMFNRYVQGLITKRELDKYMEEHNGKETN